MRIGAKKNLGFDYFKLLNSLSPDIKLELIARLFRSLKSEKNVTNVSWKNLYGALELDQPIDKFLVELKRDRKFTRNQLTCEKVSIEQIRCFSKLKFNKKRN